LAKVGEYYGIPRCRQLYERGLKLLEGQELIEFGVRFSKFERKLGEIDRARAIYTHLS